MRRHLAEHESERPALGGFGSLLPVVGERKAPSGRAPTLTKQASPDTRSPPAGLGRRQSLPRPVLAPEFSVNLRDLPSEQRLGADREWQLERLGAGEQRRLHPIIVPRITARCGISRAQSGQPHIGGVISCRQHTQSRSKNEALKV
jgi:hypothetical protein